MPDFRVAESPTIRSGGKKHSIEYVKELEQSQVMPCMYRKQMRKKKKFETNNEYRAKGNPEMREQFTQ